jgi:hypothetical protein
MTPIEATSQAGPTSKAVWAYYATVLVSAFLLFEIQLILAKYFLPWFGGTPALWTTCMFFFQTLLVFGYIYAHVLAEKVPLRRQGIVHLIVLGIALVVSVVCCVRWHSPLLPGSSWKPNGAEHPVVLLMTLLSLSTGLSYFTLSTTGPLLQSWFRETHASISPYGLYGLSNLGSFLALLSYPLLVEPWLSLRMQGWFWLGFYGVFLLSCSYCALLLPRNALEDAPIHRLPRPATTPPNIPQRLLWFAFSACGSLLFLATTNQICQNIAVVPLLWVLPLSIYLLTLVICFEKESYYSRAVFHPAWVVAVLLVVFLLSQGALTRLFIQIAAYSLILFIGCMVCHGELVKSKPAARYLTGFYLLVSIGGATAGVFVVLLAPNLFTGFWEYEIGLWVTALLMLVSVTRDRDSWVYSTRFGPLLIAVTAAALPLPIILMLHGKIGSEYGLLLLLLSVGVLMVARKAQPGYSKPKAQAAILFGSFSMLLLAGLFVLGLQLQTSAILRVRNFYGVLMVKPINQGRPDWSAYGLSHGMISHGFQFRSPDKRHLPTSYFGADSGVGRAIRVLRQDSANQNSPAPLRLGVIGLGVGTLAAYAQPNDAIRFYEINPEVISIANDPQYFTYLADCPAKKEIVAGDARLAIEREISSGKPSHFDLLVLDAFSGDAPPVHLLTIEAFRLYTRELARNGILAVNITNTYVDLRPVVLAAAAEIKLNATFVHNDGDGGITLYSDWMLLSRRELPSVISTYPQTSSGSLPVLWTDDYSNLLRVLR